MRCRRLTLAGFKSFAKKTEFVFDEPISAIVGPNGSGKSNVVEAIRFVLGEQSNKSLRSRQTSDLIYKGSEAIRPANRAEVEIVFDNTDRAFSLHSDDNNSVELGFDEIVITRVVHQDGAGEYKINGSTVRLRDIHELIASVNIGTSSHHIISQGEADRVLLASPKERREMIEDALGLKVYQFRMREAEKKLEKATNNIREIELQRKELAPHLRHLKREVERIEQAKKIRTELETEYREYLAREYQRIDGEEKRLKEKRAQLVQDIETLRERKKKSHEIVQGFTDHRLRESLQQATRELRSLEQELQLASREVGQLEGKMTGLRETLDSMRQVRENERDELDGQPVPYSVVARFTKRVLDKVQVLETETSLAALHAGMTEIKGWINEFQQETSSVKGRSDGELGVLVKLESQLSQLQDDIEQATTRHDRLEKQYRQKEHAISVMRQDLGTKEQERNQAERELISVRSELDKASTALEYHERQVTELRHRDERFQEEIEEGVILIGQGVRQYPTEGVFAKEELTEESLWQRRKGIERKKLKLEDMGAGGGREVMDEYDEAKERDEFLARELHDLEASIEALTKLHGELEKTLQESFMSGIDNISQAFHQFFTAMFGGGRANLETVEVKRRRKTSDESGDDDEDEASEVGIAIRVKLPNKKVAEIDMLSGGERSLTSIALLFALSQVNPPPFLVLDETDAALDEANSKRYGDMLEELSKVAQLIVVTHNRETMSRAQNLYGVTMMAEGASQVLSIKLEEALETAK